MTKEKDKLIDFKKYRYFYNGAIFRINKETEQVERLWKGEFHLIHPTKSFDETINDPFDDLSELFENSNMDIDLLQRELNKYNN